MKKTMKSIAVGLILLAGVAFNSHAADKTIEKAREAVEQASPDDWYTLAVSAEKCFKKNVNLKEATEWLDASLAIAETPFNLSLKGDYYLMNRLPDKAVKWYVKALGAIKNDPGSSGMDIVTIQRKIASITEIGG